ncbi:MAG: hypothetical protein AAF414_21340 [Pseudomonadota bacterium]
MISATLLWPGYMPEADHDAIVDAHASSKRTGDGRIDHNLTLQASRRGTPLWTKEISFKVDAPFDVPDLANDDPFAIAALFPAMEAGGTLRFHGRVSRTLIRNLLDYQSAWHTAAPTLFQPFTIEVAEIDDAPTVDPGPNPSTILAFSGGLDSMLALCRNVSGDAGSMGHRIDASVMIHGMATGREIGADATQLTRDLRAMSERWDIPMAVVDTDMAESVGKLVLSHGSLLAACLSLFAGQYDVGLLGSSVVFYSTRREILGSHPSLDRLLSGNRMTVRTDEGLYDRVDKAAYLSRYPDAADDLRICNHYHEANRNCCRCEKCVRTMLCFIASGNPIPAAFQDGLNLNDIGIGMGKQEYLEWAEFVIKGAKNYGTEDHEAIKMLRRRYRSKRLKVLSKTALNRFFRGKRRHRWYALEDF